MEPTYYNGQFLILDKHPHDFKQGDVVAIKKPGIKGYLVKRIVAVPGDMVCIREGYLYVNGEFQDGIYAMIDFSGIAEEPILLGISDYFVLGDNIRDSIDSRYEKIGLIKRKEIKGKVI